MLNCAFNLPYFSFLNYSPRGKTSASENSRNLCGSVKAGRSEVINAMVQALANHDKEELKPFFNKEVSLVPIPRSALLREGDMWPALEICKELIKQGLAKDILPILNRSQPIKKSSFQLSAESRPMVIDHYNSITLERELSIPENVTLIDDVLTLGRTAYAWVWDEVENVPDTLNDQIIKQYLETNYPEYISYEIDGEVLVISFDRDKKPIEVLIDEIPDYL